MIEQQPTNSGTPTFHIVQEAAPHSLWPTSNLDPSDAQFILRDWLGLHRIRALDSHTNFDGRFLGTLLERTAEMSRDIRQGRQETSDTDWALLLVQARILELRPPRSSETQKIPLLVKTLMAETVAGASGSLVLATNVNRYVVELLEHLGNFSETQGLLQRLECGKVFGALHLPMGGQFGVMERNEGLEAMQTVGGKLFLKGTARFVTGAPVADELIACALVQMRDTPTGALRPTLVALPLRRLGVAGSPAGQVSIADHPEVPCIVNVDCPNGVECEGLILGRVGEGELALSPWATRANLDAAVMACGAASTVFWALSQEEFTDVSPAKRDALQFEIQARVETIRTIVCAVSKWSEFEPFELGVLATAGLNEAEKNSIQADTANLIPFLLPMCRLFIQSEVQAILMQAEGYKSRLSAHGALSLACACETFLLSNIFDGYLEKNDMETCIRKVEAPDNKTLTSCFYHFRKLRNELCDVPKLKETIDAWWGECEQLSSAGEKMRLQLSNDCSCADAAHFTEDFSRYFGAVLGAYWFIQHARASVWILDNEEAGQTNPEAISISDAKCERPEFYQGKISRVRHFVKHVVPRYRSSSLF